MMTITVKKETSLLGKSLGLIGKEKPYPLYFQTRWGIHTFGLRFPIDVLILDNKNSVQKIKKFLRPNRIFIWNPQFYRIIELPAGTIDKLHINHMDNISILLHK